MSADRWSVCPKCKKENSVDEEKQTNNMREDYELYTDEDGDFSVRYSCHCYKCDFSWEYKYTKNIMEEQAPQ